MRTWDAITARRNVREYTDRPVPAEHLDLILEAGRRTPSSRNWQPWDFIVVTDRRELAELSGVWRGAAYVAGAAAAVALVAPASGEPTHRERVQYDLGQATMSIMLAAADLGIGSGHALVVDQDLARKILGFPADRFCPYLVALGYPPGRPLRPIVNPDRRPFADLVHRDRW
jgi:nitroreductase